MHLDAVSHACIYIDCLVTGCSMQVHANPLLFDHEIGQLTRLGCYFFYFWLSNFEQIVSTASERAKIQKPETNVVFLVSLHHKTCFTKRTQVVVDTTLW
ncbi:hypothetical protein ABY42_18580 (plasmid) [Haloferax gibbonsii]|uniref:Uncharacterized protein n=1 Tax=Haloferax gibbonsii TaxID=35746 RepID=A0A0K1IZD4_HALGI|nr:hypothetical protein ABY42_18580 [Haloferax gibbonsii]